MISEDSKYYIHFSEGLIKQNELGEDVSGFIAYFPNWDDMKLVETGITKEDAFNELMLSLVVKLAYDNEITPLSGTIRFSKIN